LAVVAVDERGRMTIPKELALRGTTVTVIPAGAFFVVVPVPNSPLEISGKWLDSKRTKSSLKALAEKAARLDAVKRAKKRKQL
jgi:virulence-associated protein VagC